MQIIINTTAEQDAAIAHLAANHRATHEPHKDITDKAFVELRINEYLGSFVEHKRNADKEKAKDVLASASPAEIEAFLAPRKAK